MLNTKINNNLKLYISYILFNSFYKYLSFRFEKFNNICILIKSNKTYYFLLHHRLSSNLFVNQLADIFTYELFLKNTNSGTQLSHLNTTASSVVVYNIHNIIFNTRFFIFNKMLSRLNTSSVCSTVSELYTNANWLEREIAELHGLQFTYKKDLRNLMLQYGDTSTPFKKSFPSTGFRETIYDIITDSVIQNRLDLQN